MRARETLVRWRKIPKTNGEEEREAGLVRTTDSARHGLRIGTRTPPLQGAKSIWQPCEKPSSEALIVSFWYLGCTVLGSGKLEHPVGGGLCGPIRLELFVFVCSMQQTVCERSTGVSSEPDTTHDGAICDVLFPRHFRCCSES
ncbi:hypothetical protein IRJ41_011070 [Triplophysa rosa]|uniref:Uncharacterized protein n=1 Tax=Triplophysa rosa TaxID=992332 RepID=A0A9W7TUE5_TRIRA|nr:hypothetical protein IRJ41_011070 [Triplophysa rosa]